MLIRIYNAAVLNKYKVEHLKGHKNRETNDTITSNAKTEYIESACCCLNSVVYLRKAVNFSNTNTNEIVSLMKFNSYD